MRRYLDHNATSPLSPAVRAAMADALGGVGNPSSVHAEGRAARAAVEEARKAVAKLVGADADDVVFTSGGSEANAMALTPDLRRPEELPAARLLASAGEHPSVLSGGRFCAGAVESIRLTPEGQVDLAHLEALLEDRTVRGERALVAVQAANNETGVIQPLAAVRALTERAGAGLVIDAVQWAGRMPLDRAVWGGDAITLSAHKFGGPQGIGALVLDRGGGRRCPSLVRGGGQERGARAGTENVAAIVGFGVAADRAFGHFGAFADLAELRDHFEERLRARVPDATIFGAAVPRLPNTTCFSIPGLVAATALINFDLDGIAVSSGSACSSGKVARSHVLAAMGGPEAALAGAIRVSFGLGNGPSDVEALLASLARQLARRSAAARAA